jgi:hypothetical protein
VLNHVNRPQWLLDGSAEYAASDLTKSTSTWWPVYLTTPTRNLFQRTYDALGFYAHLREAGTDPYSVMPAMWLAPNNEAAYGASRASSDRFLDSWASSLFRERSRGEDWDATGPAITRHRATPVDITVATDDPDGQPVEIPAYSNGVYNLHVAADLLEVEAGGHVRISDGKVDDLVLGQGQYCTRPGGCACPGEDDTQSAPTPLKHDSVLAVTGGTFGASAVLTGVSIDFKKLCCASRLGHPVTTDGLTITPVVTCRRIGLFIDKDGGLRFRIGFALYRDHPRLVPHVSKKGEITGVELEGITGFVLDFGAGAADPPGDNKNFKLDVPVEIEVPVQPPVRGLPRSFKVRWSIVIKTAITGKNSAVIARGKYGLAGPLGVRNGAVVGPTPTVVESILDRIKGITLGPSGIVIAVKTRFTAGAGTPPAMKGAFTALTASFGVTKGSSLGARASVLTPFALCVGASLDLVLAAGRGGASVKKNFFHADEILPPDVPICGS